MNILLWRSLHIIAMTAWFSGLFYLPRLFVYHVVASDKVSIDRFKLMERRLYYGITWPSAIFLARFIASSLDASQVIAGRLVMVLSFVLWLLCAKVC